MGMSDKGQLPKFLSLRSKHGTPTIPMIVGFFAVLMGCSFNFSDLLSMVNILYIFTQFMQIAALVKLRKDNPNIDRPWQVIDLILHYPPMTYQLLQYCICCNSFVVCASF